MGSRHLFVTRYCRLEKRFDRSSGNRSSSQKLVAPVRYSTMCRLREPQVL